MQQDREAYMEAGSGSATDNATSAARHKMATTVEARIISNVVKVVEIRTRTVSRRKTMGGNQYLLELEREQQLENSCQYCN